MTELPKAEILVVKADVVVPEEVKGAIDAAVAKFGKLDIVIANAGMANSWTQRTYTFFTLLVKFRGRGSKLDVANPLDIVALAEMNPNEWWRSVSLPLA